MDTMLPQTSDSNTPDAWREVLAIALQGQYGGAKPWARLDETARDAWRRDAADVMASLPDWTPR